jgi:hypothetical protein
MKKGTGEKKRPKPQLRALCVMLHPANPDSDCLHFIRVFVAKKLQPRMHEYQLYRKKK